MVKVLKSKVNYFGVNVGDEVSSVGTIVAEDTGLTLHKCVSLMYDDLRVHYLFEHELEVVELPNQYEIEDNQFSTLSWVLVPFAFVFLCALAFAIFA